MVRDLSMATLDPNLRKNRGLYSFCDTQETQWETKKQQIHDFGNLSLFRDLDNESTVSASSPREEIRPMTPINESIKSVPKTYESLSKLIHRRICPRSDWTHVSVEDQSSLGAVIMGEVNTVWPLLRKQVADPFLTHQQNRELQRRIIVHCISVCEYMFLHYSEKVKVLNSKGIFTNSANMSRIRGQLAIDTGKYLNILSVRRHIIADLKKPEARELITFSREEARKSPTTPLSAPSPKHLSFSKLVKSSRPPRKLKYQFNLNAEIRNMQSLMPTISLSKIQEIEDAIKNSKYMINTDYGENDKEVATEYETSLRKDSASTQSSPRFFMKRCPSEPIIPHTLLLDEMLQIEKEEEDYLLMRSPSLLNESRTDHPPVTPVSHKDSCKIKSHSSLGIPRVPPTFTSINLKDEKGDLNLLDNDEKYQNLENHVEIESGEIGEDLDDLPPLIQAITRRQAQDAKLHLLKQKEVDLDEKAEKDWEERMKPLPIPEYPQPAIVQSKLPGASNPMTRKPIVIRASDVKINDRVDLSSVTLQSYQPVYNDLTGDISQSTIKELDANLFQGGELREVYSELMKTVPNIHQRYDNDPLIVSPAMNVDLSKILASSTLIRPRSQQVINPKLQHDEFDMPWEGQQLNWQNASRRPYSGYPQSDLTTDTHTQGEGYITFHRFTPNQLNHPGIEKGSRAYASWLQWWKSIVNSDDYFKYLSTQDTDFLSVIFHFYDSEFGDSETESMRTERMNARRDREQKLAELKQQKEEYVPGMWNTRTITLGGLGKDPKLEEENEFDNFETPRSTNQSQIVSQSDMLSPSGSSKSLARSRSSPRGTLSLPRNKSDVGTPRDSKHESESHSIQQRLEIVWRKLRLPDSEKLNYALKYSTDKYTKILPELVTSWESVTDAILSREKLLSKLEEFEKEASDPNRFFEKGHKGSSLARLNEAKTRASLYKKIELIEMRLRSALISIKRRYSDIVSLDGRSYLEKMDGDKIEMLYYLQQVRRCNMLREHGQFECYDAFVSNGFERTIAVLPPINKKVTHLPLHNVCLSVPE